MKAFVVSALAIILCLDTWAEGVPCWIRCHHPPEIRSAQQVPCVLRSSPNPPLKLLPRSTGLLTTYGGKLLGVQGWKDYHLLAQVSGTVVQATGSDDGLYTIDLQIRQLTVGGQLVELSHGSFIRVEVFPFVRIGAWVPVFERDDLCIAGALMWDADGFLEIHPKKG